LFCAKTAGGAKAPPIRGHGKTLLSRYTQNVRRHSNRAAMLGARHVPPGLLARVETALTINCVAFGLHRGFAEKLKDCRRQKAASSGRWEYR
jgi:hypothetical protein